MRLWQQQRIWKLDLDFNPSLLLRRQFKRLLLNQTRFDAEGSVCVHGPSFYGMAFPYNFCGAGISAASCSYDVMNRATLRAMCCHVYQIGGLEYYGRQ